MGARAAAPWRHATRLRRACTQACLQARTEYVALLPFNFTYTYVLF